MKSNLVKMATMLLLAGVFSASSTFAQVNKQQPDTVRNRKGGGYLFTRINDTEATSIKNQGHTGTCWDFSTTSFFESELLREGKGYYDLSEMFTVWHAYYDKSVKYVRMHGHLNFGEGGEFHDVRDMFEEYGAIPNSVYNGFSHNDTLVADTSRYNQAELEKVLKSTLDAVVSAPSKTLTSNWKNAVTGILNAYLGKIPSTFQYKGKTYTPKTFAASLGLNMNDYVEITSFNHHPFYTQFPLEVEDNWAWDRDYNVPLKEMMAVIDNSLKKGYSVAWGGDISNYGFSFKNGVAIVPDIDTKHITQKEYDTLFVHPIKEKVITQAYRQRLFDNYTTTDDHGMQIVGRYKDQDGTIFYKVKNSWGTGNHLKGYFYASAAYVMLNTTDIMVNKAVIPKKIAKKLGVK